MIKLEPMIPDDFQAYLEPAIREYAAEKLRAGNYAESEALERSRQEYEKLLPQGVATPDHYLYTAVEDSIPAKVGMIWFHLFRPGEAFIYELRIYDAYQGKGYGKQTMLAAEQKARELGVHKLSLHVFGHNTIARALYERLGYTITNISMAKELE